MQSLAVSEHANRPLALARRHSGHALLAQPLMALSITVRRLLSMLQHP